MTHVDKSKPPQTTIIIRSNDGSGIGVRDENGDGIIDAIQEM